jgi:hypothetical protein
MDFKIPQRHCARRSSSQLASNTGKSFGWAQIRCLISGMCASEHAALIRQKERTQSHQLFKQSAHTHTHTRFRAAGDKPVRAAAVPKRTLSLFVWISDFIWAFFPFGR